MSEQNSEAVSPRAAWHGVQMPQVSLRLSKSQLNLLRPGLLRMRVAVQRFQAGKSPNPDLPVSWEPDPPDRKYVNVMAEGVVRLWTKLSSAFSRPGRSQIQLNVIDLAACRLAAAASKRLHRHQHADFSSKRFLAVRRRLLRALERAHRRTRRATVAAVGTAAYDHLVSRWKDFERWLRYYALSCRCGKALCPSLKRPYYKRTVDTAVEVATRELTSRACEVPAPSELRRLVRLAIREVRRYRTSFGIKPLLDKPQGANYLAWFVLQRTHDQSNQHERSSYE